MKKLMNFKYTLLIFLLIGFFQNVFAYPITPRPLRKLIKESENIVVAYVVKSENIETDHWINTRSVLAIREVLQGNIKSDTIHVYYSFGMTCPAPAKYKDSTMVIAFLDKRKDGDGYITHALSYGSKTLDNKGIELYKKRISEMQAIQKIKKEHEKTSKTTDWLIKCAKYSETRWEGVYELSPESDFMSYYDQDKETFIRKYTLNKNQKSELRKILLAIPQLEYSDIGLADLVKKENDTELINHLTKNLKSPKTENLWYSILLMKKIAAIAGRADLKLISQEMEKTYCSEGNYEKKREKIKEFINKMH
ncbi:MAG: hypothetical protein GY795_42700 [Desulfobacterales bacterium]|nr:hypothetical protein [Desulfobacterales bacterium]